MHQPEKEQQQQQLIRSLAHQDDTCPTQELANGELDLPVKGELDVAVLSPVGELVDNRVQTSTGRAAELLQNTPAHSTSPPANWRFEPPSRRDWAEL